MRMNKIMALGLAAAMAAGLAGCDTITGGPLIRPGEPTATLIIINETYGYLDAVVISDCNAMSYGFNRLGDNESIPPGGERSFVLSAGCWDVGTGEFAGGEAYERMTLYPNDVMRYRIYE
jgi:hypothetical protein